MPQQAWNAKRERQYEHIKEGLEDRGRSERTAKQIAARTVNKERARSGEAKESSRTSTQDISSGRRGGLHGNLQCKGGSHREGRASSSWRIRRARRPRSLPCPQRGGTD